MKILKKKKENFFFLRFGIFFSNWEKSHLNPIGKGAEFRPLRTPKKIPDRCYIKEIIELYINIFIKKSQNVRKFISTVPPFSDIFLPFLHYYYS